MKAKQQALFGQSKAMEEMIDDFLKTKYRFHPSFWARKLLLIVERV